MADVIVVSRPDIASEPWIAMTLITVIIVGTLLLAIEMSRLKQCACLCVCCGERRHRGGDEIQWHDVYVRVKAVRSVQPTLSERDAWRSCDAIEL